MSAVLHSIRRALEAWVADWALRRQPRASTRLRLGHRQIYILPTRFGVLYAALAAILLVTALHYNNNMVFAFDFMLAGLGANAMWLTHRNLLNLELRFEGAEPVFAGGEAGFQLRFANPSRASRPALELQWDDGPVTRFRLAPGQCRSVYLRVPAQHRGRLRPGRFVLRCEYPLGLFRAWSWAVLDMETLVWPAPWPGEHLPAPAPQPDAGGEQPQERPGDEDFAGIRPYRRGDAPQRMAWKAMAHLQQPHTKEFSTPRAEAPRLWIDWADLPATPREERLSRLCGRILDAADRGATYGLRLPGLTIEPGAGEDHRRRCLTALALYPGDSG